MTLPSSRQMASRAANITTWTRGVWRHADRGMGLSLFLSHLQQLDELLGEEPERAVVAGAGGEALRLARAAWRQVLCNGESATSQGRQSKGPDDVNTQHSELASWL